MTYRVEYNGGDIEVTTLDAALDNAKHAIASDVGPISGWTVEHDETINDWFVQGVVNGRKVGSTAVISGPEPMISPVMAPRHPAREDDGWVQHASFVGPTAADSFAAATHWLSGRASVVRVTDVTWSDGRLRIYFHDATG